MNSFFVWTASLYKLFIGVLWGPFGIAELIARIIFFYQSIISEFLALLANPFAHLHVWQFALESCRYRFAYLCMTSISKMIFIETLSSTMNLERLIECSLRRKIISKWSKNPAMSKRLKTSHPQTLFFVWKILECRKKEDFSLLRHLHICFLMLRMFARLYNMSLCFHYNLKKNTSKENKT